MILGIYLDSIINFEYSYNYTDENTILGSLCVVVNNVLG